MNPNNSHNPNGEIPPELYGEWERYDSQGILTPYEIRGQLLGAVAIESSEIQTPEPPTPKRVTSKKNSRLSSTTKMVSGDTAPAHIHAHKRIPPFPPAKQS